MNGQLDHAEKEPPESTGSPPVATTTASLGLSNQALQSQAKSLATANGSAPAAGDPAGPAAADMIVEDTADTIGPGQMKKSDFLAALKTGVCATAAEALAGTPWSEKGCPYIEHWFTFYQLQDASHVERAVRKYAPLPGTVSTASAYIPAIEDRVRRATGTWVSTGLVLGVPEGIPMGLPEAGGSMASGAPASSRRAGAVMAKLREGASLGRGDPRAIQAELGAGRPLAGEVRSRIGAAFGHDFSDTRMHTDGAANRLSSGLNARAFTIGEHIAFASGEYRPGTLVGDALIAHELAHVAQQRGSGPLPSQAPGAGLEHEADLAAAGAVLELYGGGLRRALPQIRPTAARGLRLSRCSVEKVPADLSTVQAKAEWINQALAGSSSLFDPKPGNVLSRTKGQAIVDMLSTLTAAEFIDIQSKINMSDLLDELKDFEAVRMGTLGPVRGDIRDRLNHTRADYLYKMTSDRHPAEGQVVAHWIFANMYGNDIQEVLTLLGADQHLYNTVDEMPIVLDLFKQRGIDRSKFQDRSWKAKDIATGIGHFGKHFFESSQAAREAKSSEYGIGDLELPQAYLDALIEVGKAEFEAAATPGNIVLGALNQAAFGIPGAVVGVVSGTVSGIKDVAQGHVEAGTEKLTGSAIFIVGLVLGARAFRKSARMAALMELTPEGQAAFVELRAKIGQSGIDRVAKYVQANSEAAFLVREQGLAGIEALHKAGGNVAAARAAIGVNMARLGPLLTTDTLAGLGTTTQQALATLSDGTLRALAGAEPATLDALAQMLRETSPAMRARLTALAESNPAAFGELMRTQKTAVLETLRTGPFSSVEELGSAVGKSAGRVRVPVVKDGVTLYESIDPAKPPPGWKFEDQIVSKRGGSVTIRTNVTGPNNATGFFVRRVNPATGELEMLEAYLRSTEAGPEIPGSVPSDVELRPGKGTPTVTYATLRQLRTQGVKMGGLRRIVMRNIENFKSICRLEWMRRNFPGRTLNQLVLDTDSVSYATTAAEQAGSRVAGGRLAGGRTQPIGNLMTKYEHEAAQVGGVAAAEKVQTEHAAILQQYGLSRETPMLTNFDIELDLEPITPQTQGTPSQ